MAKLLIKYSLYKLALKNQSNFISSKQLSLLRRQQNECTFSPTLVTKSYNNYHNNSLIDDMPVHERLYNPNYLQQRDEKLKELRDQEELKGCTFSPQLVNSPRYNRQSFEYENSVYERLYELARIKQMQQQQQQPSSPSAAASRTPTSKNSSYTTSNPASVPQYKKKRSTSNPVSSGHSVNANRANAVPAVNNKTTSSTSSLPLLDYDSDDNNAADDAFDPANYTNPHDIDALIQQVLQDNGNNDAAPENVVNENENDNKVEEEVDVSFLSDEQ